MSKEIEISEWACDNCHTVFYTYLAEEDGAVCPECGDPARYCGQVKFILRDEEFEDAVNRILQQDCREGCWIYDRTTMTEEERREAEEVIRECCVAKLRRILGYEKCCPAECE